MSKKMIIKLSPNGEIQMTTQGVKGKKCLDYVKLLEKVADVKITKQELTSEYYEQEEVAYNNIEEEEIYEDNTIVLTVNLE